MNGVRFTGKRLTNTSVPTNRSFLNRRKTYYASHMHIATKHVYVHTGRYYYLFVFGEVHLTFHSILNL